MRSIRRTRSGLVIAAAVLAAGVAGGGTLAAQTEGGVTASEALQALAQRTQAGQLSAAHGITDALRARCISGVKLQQSVVGVDALDRLITERDASTLVAFADAQDAKFLRDAKSPFCTEGNVPQQAAPTEAAPPPPPPPPPPPD
jgi:hypothetical protein